MEGKLMRNKKSRIFIVCLLILTTLITVYKTTFAAMDWADNLRKNVEIINTKIFSTPALLFVSVLVFIVLFYICALISCLFAKLRYQKHKAKTKEKNMQFLKDIDQLLHMPQEKEYDKNVIPIEVIKKTQFNMRNK